MDDSASRLPDPATPDLDRWLPEATVRTQHRRRAQAPATALWQAATGVRLRDCRLLGRLVARRLGVGDPSITFDALLRRHPFVLLDEGPTWSLSGVCGRIWTVRSDLAEVADADAFRAWREPGTVRVLFAHWAAPAGSGAVLHSEVRVAPVDRRAGMYLRALEPFIAVSQNLIGRESLALAVRLAEQNR